MVFNGSQFWLFASFDGHALKLVRGTWAAPGSASLVRHFFYDQPPLPPPPLLPLLRKLLSALHLRPAQMDGSAFLGAGGSGRVFAVESTQPTTRHAQRMALKLVPAATSATWLIDLTHEYKAMQDATALGLPVVPVVANSLHVVDDVGGGYLLARCGVLFDATSLGDCSAAFVSLAALHSRAVLHGDARLPNLLVVDGHAAWVDLSAGHMLGGLDARTRAANCSIDMETLAQSVLQAADVSPTPLPPSVAAALAAYSSSDSGAEAVATLAAAVWAAAQGGVPRLEATLAEAGAR
jgi:cell division inhibitor SulA